MADPSVTQLANEAENLLRDFKALTERVDYLHVATMKGDPRFAKPEYANPQFDSKAFDRDWSRRGKRIPTLEEVFG